MPVKRPIIFVDDDEDDQFIFSEICRNLRVRHEVRFFNLGTAVLNYLRTTKEQPFVIFCDINMPVMDGLQIREQIYNEELLRRKSIPFVFFSTAASRKQIKLAYDMTVQGFFIKEHGYAAMEAAIKMILEYWGKCKHPNS